VIPAYNEEGYISRCLSSVLEQDYPRGRLQVWLVDAGSTDATVELAREQAASDGRVEIISGNGRLNPMQAVNLGIARSSADLIARVDGHSFLERDYLRRAGDVLGESGPDVACVGGRPEQEGETRFGRAFARARTSRFGVGGSVYAGREQRVFVDTLQCGVYRRSALERVGRFDPEMDYGEDEELNWRLRRSGYRILLDTSIRFHYYTRSSWRAAFRQYRNYGGGRVRVVAKHPDFLRAHHLAPAALVTTLAALALTSPFGRTPRRLLAASALTYSSLAVASALEACGRENLDLVPWASLSYPALHFGYGIGMLEALPAVLAGASHPAGKR
jgi:succinoglycan biosynthesis protein ExoA